MSCRGDGRQLLFHDDRHYQRFTEGLEAEVLRSEGKKGTQRCVLFSLSVRLVTARPRREMESFLAAIL